MFYYNILIIDLSLATQSPASPYATVANLQFGLRWPTKLYAQSATSRALQNLFQGQFSFVHLQISVARPYSPTTRLRPCGTVHTVCNPAAFPTRYRKPISPAKKALWPTSSSLRDTTVSSNSAIATPLWYITQPLTHRLWCVVLASI